MRLVLPIITYTVKREKSSFTSREALSLHILSPSAAGDWNVDSTCQCLCSNAFPHSDNRLSAQWHLLNYIHLTAALLSHKPRWITTKENGSALTHLSLFQPWSFMRSSMTWPWRKGWRAGSCTRRWRASRGTSPYWRWDFLFLFFLCLLNYCALSTL